VKGNAPSETHALNSDEPHALLPGTVVSPDESVRRSARGADECDVLTDGDGKSKVSEHFAIGSFEALSLLPDTILVSHEHDYRAHAVILTRRADEDRVSPYRDGRSESAEFVYLFGRLARIQHLFDRWR
jgi:hypothetical protein